MDPQTAAALSAIAACISTVAAIATALVGMYALAGSRADSRDRTRPVIVAELRPATLTRGLDLVLKNHGASTAKNVRVAFDPPIVDPAALPISDDMHWIGLRYAEPIPVWAPGVSFSNVFHVGTTAADPITVKVAYMGQDGRGYHDHFRLIPQAHATETRTSPGSGTDPQVRMVQAVEAVARAVDRR